MRLYPRHKRIIRTLQQNELAKSNFLFARSKLDNFAFEDAIAELKKANIVEWARFQGGYRLTAAGDKVAQKLFKR